MTNEEKKRKVLAAFDNGEIDEADARDMIGRIDAGGDSVVYTADRPIIEEAHPDLDVKDRLDFKNFAVNFEDAKDEFEQRYPEHAFKIHPDKGMLMRKKGEPEWRKIDPQGFGPGTLMQKGMEGLKDVGDVLYDIPAVAAETTAAIAGGTAGAGVGTVTMGPGVGTGIGAVGGAALAGGATGAATEGLRQTIGQQTGMAKEYDPTMIGVSGGFGAASPLLFGTGATLKTVTKQLIKKQMAKGASREAAETFAKAHAPKILNAQRSVLGRGVGKVVNATTANVGSWVSGYTPQQLKGLRDRINKGLFDKMSLNPAEIPKMFKKDLDGAIKAKKDILNKAYTEALDALNVKIDAGKAEKELLDLLTEYEKRAEAAVPGFKDALKKAEVPEELAGMSDDLAGFLTGKIGRLSEAAEEGAEAASKADLNKIEVQNYLYLKDTIEPYLKGNQELEGKAIVQYLDQLNDLTKIRKNVNVQGMSKVDQDLVRVSKQVADKVNKGLDDTIEGQAFKNIKSQHAQVYKDLDTVKTYMKDDKAVERVLKNFGSPSQDVRADDLMDLARRYDLNIEDAANDAYFIKEFGQKAASMPKFLGGTSGTLRPVPLAIGAGYLGYSAGQQNEYLSPYLTAALAGSAGMRAGSPAALRRYTQIGRRMRQGADAVRPAVAPAAGLYQQMNQQDRFPREK